MSIDLFMVGITQGLVLAIIAMAIMIPYRILDFPDLTCEGSFPLGGAICAVLLISDINPIAAIVFAGLCSGLMGICTGLISLKFKVNSLLAGIILSTMIYSVNLRVMGKPNLALFDTSNIFNLIYDSSDSIYIIIFLSILILLIYSGIYMFFQTDYGLKFRSVGYNKAFATKNGISVTKYTLLGLFIAGFMTGMAGGLNIQLQQYMDIGMGIGIVIHGLAALMLGEAIVDNNNLARQLAAPIIGALIYQQIQGIVLSVGLAPTDLKLCSGLIVLIIIGTKYYIRRSKNAC